MSDVDMGAFLRDGFAIIRGLFTPDEAEAIRGATIQEVERLAETGEATITDGAGDRRISPRGDMLTYEPLRGVLLDPRLIGAVSEVLGDQPCFWGESAVSIGALGGGARAWHTDAYDTPVTKGPRYPLVRCGLYFQDTKDYSDGLTIVAGSHLRDLNVASLGNKVRGVLRPWLGSPKAVLIEAKPGDLLIWDMRVLHSGEVVRFKPAPSLALPLNIQGRLPASLRLPAERRRVVMFPTFGLPGPDLDSWLESRRQTTYMPEIWRASRFSTSVVDEAANAGLRVIRPVPYYGEAEVPDAAQAPR